MRKYIIELGERILSGDNISFEEALSLEKVEGADLFFLSAYASKIREQYHGDKVDLCSIVSARTGGCGENCAFCAQSSHYNTGVNVEINLNEEAILNQAKALEAEGIHRFDIVTSGKGYTLNDPEFIKILNIFIRLRKETSLQLCACLGAIGEEEALALREVGVTRYNHNLEAAESFFPNVVSTHSYKDREKTIHSVKKAGMEVCSGGIIGMGETFAQRIEFAMAIRDLGVDSVPVNILNPIAGTPLEKQQALNPLDVIKTMSVFRLILPKVNMRFAGGREANLGDLQVIGFISGINGMLTGNYLTTKGQGISSDLEMITRIGLKY